MRIPPLMDLEHIPQMWLWHTKDRVTLVPYSNNMEINGCKQFIGFIAHIDNKLYFINQANVDPLYQKDFVMSLEAIANFKPSDLSIYLYFYEVMHHLELLFESKDDRDMTVKLLENYRLQDDV